MSPHDCDRARSVACEAAMAVLTELEARGGYPEDDLCDLRRHYRRLERRTGR